MTRHSSFPLTTALLGLFVIILPFFGLPPNFKTILFLLLGGLIILFSLADADRTKSDESDKANHSEPAVK